MAGARTSPIHPGEILFLEFLQPLGITQYRLAKSVRVPPRRINEIIKGQRAITADTAVRLGLFFGTSAIFWLNLQSRFDIRRWRKMDGGKIEGEIVALIANGKNP